MTPAVWVLGLGLTLLGSGDFGITVEAAAPDAFCPAVDATREAVRARIGTIDVPNGGSWRVLYTIVHSPGTSQGDTIRLELRDPDGALKLEREIPIAGESCATLAQIVGLVLERYFRELSSADRPPEPVTAVLPSGTSPVAPLQTVPERPERGPERRALPGDERPTRAAPNGRESEPHGLLVGLFGGASSVTRSPATGAELRLRLGTMTRFRASILFPLRAREEPLGEGTVSLTEYPLRLALTAGLESGAWDLEVGPELLLAAEQGRAENLQDATRGWRVIPGLGLHSTALYWFSSRWGLELGVSADAVARGTARAFIVAEKEVLSPAILRGAARIGLAWSILE